MAKALQPYIHRAPRYVLNANDNRMLRFVRDNMSNQSFSTEIVNLSESGLIFTIDRPAAPQLNEVIKIEFAAPGDESLAWFARVVRVELASEYAAWKENSNEVRVAVRFEQLPDGHRQLLRSQLRERMEHLLYLHRMRHLTQARKWIFQHRYLLLIYIAVTIAIGGVLFLLSRPSMTYDERNPTIWGERFK